MGTVTSSYNELKDVAVLEPSHDSSRRIIEMKGERMKKPGVMKLDRAAPWSSVKQRACSNIW